MTPVEPERGDFRTSLSPDDVERIRLWHDRAYAEAHEEGSVERRFDYLGVTIVVPPEVMPITPMSHLLGDQVRASVKAGDRVLDMGTGSGVNAVVAARGGGRVLAVDINPRALVAASENASRNGVADLVEVRWSDVFSDVDGAFDLIVFDPPFRWFKPRDLMESAMTDEGYEAMTRFFRQARFRASGIATISLMKYLKLLILAGVRRATASSVETILAAGTLASRF